jgi:excisionase family DNA binding protein
MRDLADAAGVSAAFISRLERDLVGATDSTLQAIADCLGVQVTALTTGGDMTMHATATDSSPPESDNTFLYTRPEAAERLRVTEDWLKKATARGEVPCTRVGRGYRYSPKNLRDYIEMNEIPVKPRRPRRIAA